jgi:membrane dipeptidase
MDTRNLLSTQGLRMANKGSLPPGLCGQTGMSYPVARPWLAWSTAPCIAGPCAPTVENSDTLARHMLRILDGHNDTLTHIFLPDRGRGRSFLEESTQGHIDLPRARRGGFAGGFFAIFVPPEPGDAPDPSAPSATPDTTGSTRPGVVVTEDGWEVPLPEPLDRHYALQFTIDVAASMFRLETESAGAVTIIRDAEGLRTALQHDRVAVIWHIEGAEAIDPELSTLHVFYQAGLRSLGIVWSRPNAFGHGVPFKFPTGPDIGPGLSEAGRRLVARCNELGVMVDLAHLNERGFWDVAELSTAPLVSTHTASNTLCRTARNLTDQQIDAVGRTGGVVGVNFHVGDLRADAARDPDTPLGEIVRHVDYMVDRIGIDHVAFGSDFDGATISRELGDVAGLPKLIALLQKRGYSDDDLTKLAHGNWLRVLERTWR